MLIRLQKALANANIASRRKSEEYISNGRVKVNEEVVTELGFKVDLEKDEIFVDNKKLQIEKDKIYIMLHKPEGCVTTVKDQFNRKTVFDYIKSDKRLYPVGRLDYDTSGLLILTNDGDLTYGLTHPKHNITKTYIAKVKGIPTKKEIFEFENGLQIDDYKTAKAKVFIINKGKNESTLKIIITEGRNRQVRKMCEAINHPVKTLKRVATGNLELGDLEKGDYRHLADSEIKYLRNLI